MLQNNPELRSKVGQLWNKFWSGGISNPLSAIEQITYLLFMKRLDEMDSKFTGNWIPPKYRNQPAEEMIG